ncbi:hypothetical protein B0H16DRAFT_428847 [Mycena metata]|uniref:Uncharacterized protein n=1 Tax=Mycena metata TaxID=1033252 RepID=A0AAD7JH39_9AGAR|nr:hypothetical protein B0H16DRAFT_428847 [Mycena metata]
MSDDYKNDFSDPDFLAIVVRGLLDEIDSGRRTGLPQHSSKEAELLRQALTLDSIANLCVYKDRDQIVAISAGLHPSHTAILVAENGPVSDPVLKHLRDMFDKLKTIRDTLPEGEPVSPAHPFIVNPQSPFEAALIDLDIAILLFSWDKFKKRLTKNRRLSNFTLVVNDVLGVAAEERDDLPIEQRNSLAILQASPHLNHDGLAEVGIDLENMLQALNIASTDRTPGDTRPLRILLAKVAGFHQGVAERKELFTLWNDFLKFRVSNPTSGTPQTVKKDPDTLRWLQKVVSIREHARRVARLATSRTLAGILRDVEIVAVPNQISPKIIKMNEKTMHGVLNAAQCNLNKEGGKTPADYLEKLATTAGAVQTNKETLEFEFSNPRPVHCECALLAALHGLPAIPYIGTSKLSCGFCRMYFEAYRTVTRSKIVTQGSHGVATAWHAPTVADSEIDTRIRVELAAKLNEAIYQGWNTYSRKSLDSQSPIASGEGEDDPDVAAAKQGWNEEYGNLSMFQPYPRRRGRP